MADYRLERSRLLKELVDDTMAGKRPVGMSSAFNIPAPFEIAGQMGFRWVIADMEHTLASQTQLIDMIRAADWARIPVIVKVNSGSSVEVRDALDAGASGIQAPMTNTVEDVQRYLADMRYVHQDGTRGLCPVSRSTFYASDYYAGHAHDWKKHDDDWAKEALLMPTIETEEAIDNIDELLKIEECPIWHVGGADLASSLRMEWGSEEHIVAVMWTIRKIQSAGKKVCYGFIPRLDDNEKQAALSMCVGDMPYAIDSALMAYGMAKFSRAIEMGTGLDVEKALAEQEAEEAEGDAEAGA